MRTHSLMATAVAAAPLAATSFTRAQTWTGAISTDWFTDGNWTPAVVPTGAMNTNINTTTNAPVVEAHTPGAIGATGNSVLFVGSSGTGMLTVQSGGTLSNSNLTIGQSGGTGTVTGTGAGSTLTGPSSLQATIVGGSGGTGTLTIQGGGTAMLAMGTFRQQRRACSGRRLRQFDRNAEYRRRSRQSPNCARHAQYGKRGIWSRRRYAQLQSHATDYVFAPVVSGTGTLSTLNVLSLRGMP